VRRKEKRESEREVVGLNKERKRNEEERKEKRKIFG
jgi:hypothetical protein